MVEQILNEVMDCVKEIVHEMEKVDFAWTSISGEFVNEARKSV
jgi:hypothetical protein